MSLSDTFRIVELERELSETRMSLTYATTAIRNAITELADDDTEGAIKTLQQIVGGDGEDDAG